MYRINFFNLILSCLVLSWDGDVSAVSKDAIEDARLAKNDTVIDEWDEDFDRGKVRNIRGAYKVTDVSASWV